MIAAFEDVKNVGVKLGSTLMKSSRNFIAETISSPCDQANRE